MHKKNLVIMLAAFPVLISCQKDPDWEDMDNEYMVYGIWYILISQKL